MTEPEAAFSRRVRPTDRRRLAAVALAALAVISVAAVAIGASPSPGTSSAPGATSSEQPDSSAEPREKGERGGKFKWGGRGDDMVGLGIRGRGGVEIVTLVGPVVTLRTVDGWTRTITVTSATEITKGGETITAADLAVGDSVRFRQQRNDDGTYTITRIDVVMPKVAGTVTAKTTSTITIELRGGTTATIHVDASTTYRVQGAGDTATLDDIAVGMGLVAIGEANSDGSLDALRVAAGNGRGHNGDSDKKDDDADESPEPAASASPG